MRTPLERVFRQCLNTRQVMFANREFGLVPSLYYRDVPSLEHAKCLIFDVIDMKNELTAGELSIRIGESPSMFYLGHIGYHIDPPFQGRHGAYQACMLSVPMLRDLGCSTLVITTDVDNYPSIRTCERLGCVLESTVDVPFIYQRYHEISARKRRYIWTIPK